MTTTSTAQAEKDQVAETPKKSANDRLREYVTQCWQEGEQATTDRRTQWRELWNAYQNKQTWKKADWQSQLFVPKVFVHVTKASAEIRRAMLQTQKLFKLELDESTERGKISEFRRGLARTMTEVPRIEETPEWAQIATYREVLSRTTQPEVGAALTQQVAVLEQRLDQQVVTAKIEHADKIARLNQAIRAVTRDLKDQRARMQLDDARFKSDLVKTNLARVYSEMTIVAFLLGIGVIKVGWDSKLKSVVFKHIDPFNFHVCPDWEPTSGDPPAWVIERVVVPLVDLYEAANRRNKKAGEEMYDVKALEGVQADYVSEGQEEADRRRGINSTLQRTGKVELLLFWGNVPREDWKSYEGRNRFAVIANGRHVIRNGRNPFDHGKAPYILTMPLTYPFRGHSGSSLVEPIVRANYTYNNILNLWIDGLNFTINKQFQLDPNKLRDNRQMNTVFPGKIWKVKTEADNGPVLREVPVSPMSGDALRGLDILSQDMQESTGVTEFIQGLPSKRVKTLGEMQLKTQESRGLFDVIARDLEMFSLQPTLEMAYDVYVQCADYPEREDLYHVLANGLSAMVAQGQLLEAIGSILMLAMKFPPIAQRTNIDDLYKQLLSIHNLSDCYVEPPESQVEALTPEQQDAIATKAEQQAPGIVGQMSPQEIMQVAP
jgi:hypothetical protein